MSLCPNKVWTVCVFLMFIWSSLEGKTCRALLLVLPTFSPKHFFLQFSETNCKNKMRNQEVSDSKTSSSVCSISCYSITILHHGHQEWNPAGRGVWLFTCVFMCAVKHHHESCLVSNKHHLKKTSCITANIYLNQQSSHAQHPQSSFLSFQVWKTSVSQMSQIFFLGVK